MSSVPRPARFDRFVFDAASGELTSPSGSTRLQPQVAALLEVLLERAGSVVTRAELRDRLWPDTTVEFDQGLNFCIRQLRLALGDDANAPRFIETLPRRGYRFLMPVEGTTSAPPISVPVERTPPPRSQRAIAIAAILVVLLAGSWALVANRGNSTAGQPIGVAVMPFDLETPDSTLVRYRDRLAEGIVEAMTRAGGDSMSIMGPTSTAQFDGMKTPLDTLANALGARFVVSGGIRREPDGLHLFAQLIRVRDGRHLWAKRFVDSLAADTTVATQVSAGATERIRADR
jgi:DNA-binding winged helix-turn-helix (wHTH) protein/TolB-like protein